MLAIYKKELRSYFTTMIGFIYAAIFLVIVGIYFMAYNLNGQYAKFEYTVSAIEFLYIVLIPILTMRLVAEENKQKTDQLLLTSPISITKMVLGKYFAAVTMYLAPVVIMCFYPLIIAKYASVSFGPYYATAYSCIFGFIMLAAAYIALGLFISAITENQVIALIITAIAVFISYIMPGIESMLPTDNQSSWLILSLLVVVICLILYLSIHNITMTMIIGVVAEVALMFVYLLKPSFYDGLVTKVLDVFSISEKFSNFSAGILDINAIIYFLSVAVMFILITIQVIKKRRWS
ncbi:MAG: ABC transporter permease [bacterium]|nr:ABC transporter permease [bacterium]